MTPRYIPKGTKGMDVSIPNKLAESVSNNYSILWYLFFFSFSFELGHIKHLCTSQ